MGRALKGKLGKGSGDAGKRDTEVMVGVNWNRGD